MAAADGFLESAVVHEHRYGTPRAPVAERLAAGGDVLWGPLQRGSPLPAIYASIAINVVLYVLVSLRHIPLALAVLLALEFLPRRRTLERPDPRHPD